MNMGLLVRGLNFGAFLFCGILAIGATGIVRAADNQLTEDEAKAGWILLFDGKSLDDWMTTKGKPSARPVDGDCLNPHGCGDYMLVHKKQWGDFVLSVDFKMVKEGNSGVFVRTNPLEVLPGKDVGYNGIEVQILDHPTNDPQDHDCGAICRLVRPSKIALKPIGEWNRYVITCNKNLISVELNGEKVSRIDLDEWPEAGKCPDGAPNVFDNRAMKDHPRVGYIGLQDHGSDIWFKNIKLLPLK